MNIVMLTENDPAGCAIMFKNAINAYTEHSCRLITTAEKYCFGFEKDIHIEEHINYYGGETEHLLENADIFHFHILSDESMQIGPFKVADYIKGKAIVHHHHGHHNFRANPDKYRLKYKKLNRKVLVSTPDLLLGLPEAYWMPNLVPVHNPLYMPTEERYPDFTVGHSPTRTDIKDTVTLLEAAHRAGVNVDIIMNTDHKECLRRKQKCHVIFDHLQGYYGVSSLEGLSMGKPVIADLSEFVKRHIHEFVGDVRLPWFPVGYFWMFEKRFGANVRGFIRRVEHDSRKFMEYHWSDKKVVNRLIKFYEGL